MALWYPDQNSLARMESASPEAALPRASGDVPVFPEGEGTASVARYEHPDPLCRNRGILGLERGEQRRLYELSAWKEPGLVTGLLASLQGGSAGSGAVIREVLDDGFLQLERFDLPDGVSPGTVAGKLARILLGQTPGLRGHAAAQNAFHSVAWAFQELRRTAGDPPVVTSSHRFTQAPLLVAYAGQGGLGTASPEAAATADLPLQVRGPRVVEVAQLQGWEGPYSVSVGYRNDAGKKDDWRVEDSAGVDPNIRSDYFWYGYPFEQVDGQRDYQQRVLWTDEQLRDDFKRWLVNAPLLAGDMGNQMVDRFYGGSRETWVHAPDSSLSAEAYTTNTVYQALASILASLRPQMDQGVHPTAMSIPDNQLPTINFTMGDSRVLKALIGGTQGIGVRIDDFYIWRGGRPQYRGKVLLKIYDVFGVGQSDLYHPSLIDFWILQHQRLGHHPFINELHVEHRFGYQVR